MKNSTCIHHCGPFAHTCRAGVDLYALVNPGAEPAVRPAPAPGAPPLKPHADWRKRMSQGWRRQLPCEAQRAAVGIALAQSTGIAQVACPKLQLPPKPPAPAAVPAKVPTKSVTPMGRGVAKAKAGRTGK